MSDREYSARDKITSQMTRDGLVEVNVTQGTTERVSKRLSESSFDKETVHEEAFQGHSRFTSANQGKAPSGKRRNNQCAAGMDNKAGNNQKCIENLEREIERQEKKTERSRKKATTFLPRVRISRKAVYRTTVDQETGEEQAELYKYGMYMPRFGRVIKKPANMFNLRERTVREAKRRVKRKIESRVFEGEGSENVGLEAAHKVYRGYKTIHWYIHRKDYLKSKRHRRYRAYVEDEKKLSELRDTRHKMTSETASRRYTANAAKTGDAETDKKLYDAQRKKQQNEAQKKSNKKRYQKAKYAEEHGNSTSAHFFDFIKKKDKQRREIKEAKAVASMFGSILGGIFTGFLIVGLAFSALAVFMFLCAGYAGTTDTDAGNITECDAYFSEKETKLREEILKVEEEKDSFDEYRYFVNGSRISDAKKMSDYIKHDPTLLSSFLAVSNNSYEMANSAEIMDGIFDEMYELQYKEITETRTDSEGNDYDVDILEIYLTVKELDETVKGHMNENQQQQWELLNHTGGNQQIFSSPFDFDWRNDISSKYGWRIHPISGTKKFHSGVDIAEPRGTEIHACSAGTVITATFSSSAGNYVAVQDKDGFVIKYMHCHELYVRKGDVVERGDVIAIVGTTGNSTGNHLHLQIEDPAGNTLNPVFLVKS